MTKKLNKRGFTIVELVVVIVVIAILAAVLIPTVSSLVSKANQSADTSAVRQMNEQLAITEVEEKPANIGEAIKALLGVNIKLENYTPLATNTQFYWVKSLNRVVYVNIEGGKEEIIYPTDLKDLTHTAGDWYSLNGDIEFKNYSVGTDNSVSIASAGQFAQLIDDINNKKETNISTITLTDDIDLAGATAKITATGTDKNDGFAQNITIDGSGKTVYGLRDDTQTAFGSGEFANKGYGYGLFGNIGTNGNVTIKNVVFDGITVEDTVNEASGTAGLIAGCIYGTLKLDNVTFKNCSVAANQKVGAICGWLRETGTVNLTNVSFTNTIVSGGCEVAKLIGFLDCGKENGQYNNQGANLTVSGNTDFSGISVQATTATVFSSSAFTFNNNGWSLSSDSSTNTFKVKDDPKEKRINNVTTEDWAWYNNRIVISDWNFENAVKYNGVDYNLNASSCSASRNFKDGKPVDNAQGE